MKSLKLCIRGWDSTLNICNECEIREWSVGFIHILVLGIYYLEDQESQLSGKIMIASLIKPASSKPEKCSSKQDWYTAFLFQWLDFTYW